MIAMLALIDFAAKSIALFALGLAVAALVTPRLRVLVHRATFVLALLLPLTFAVVAPRATLFAIETEAAVVLRDTAAPATKIIYDAAAQPGDFAKLTASSAVNNAPEMKPLMPEPKPLVIDWLAVLFGMWACGALFVMLRFARSYWGLARAYARGHDHPRLWLAMRAVQRDVGLVGEVDVRLSGAVASPCTFGLLKPRILLPARCDFGNETLNAVLAHEMHHIRQHDSAWLMVGRFACAVHWFNPLAWMALYRFRGDIEIVCDDAATRSSSVQTYAGALIDAARQSIAFKPAAGVSMSSHGVAARIRRLLEQEDHLPMPTRLSRGLLLATAVAALLVLEGTTFVAAQPRKVTDATSETTVIEVNSAPDVEDVADVPVPPSVPEIGPLPPEDPVVQADIAAHVAQANARAEAARAKVKAVDALVEAKTAKALRARAVVDAKATRAVVAQVMTDPEVRRALAEARLAVNIEVQRALKAVKVMTPPNVSVVAPVAPTDFTMPVPPPGAPRMIVVGDNEVIKGVGVEVERDVMDDEEGLLLLDVDRGVTVRSVADGFMCGDDAHCRFTMDRGTQVHMILSKDSPTVTWHHCDDVSPDGRSCTVKLGSKAVHVWVMAKG